MERLDSHVGDDTVIWAAESHSYALGVFAVCIVAAVLLAPFLPRLWRSARRLFEEMKSALPFAALALALVVYGGSKAKTAEFRFDTYLTNNNSWQTNNTVHVEYTYSSAIASYALHVDCQEKPATNGAAWVRLLDSTVESQPFDLTLQNASNYVFFVWTEYAAPPVVHTNGVYELRGVVRSAATTNDFAAFSDWTLPKIKALDHSFKILFEDKLFDAGSWHDGNTLHLRMGRTEIPLDGGEAGIAVTVCGLDGKYLRTITDDLPLSAVSCDVDAEMDFQNEAVFVCFYATATPY